MNQGDNPIIGYHAYDKHYNIIAPDRMLNPIFSKKRSLQAAEAYGRSQDVLDVTALH